MPFSAQTGCPTPSTASIAVIFSRSCASAVVAAALVQWAVRIRQQDGLARLALEARLPDQFGRSPGLTDPGVVGLGRLFRNHGRQSDRDHDEQQPEADRPPRMGSTPPCYAHGHRSPAHPGLPLAVPARALCPPARSLAWTTADLRSLTPPAPVDLGLPRGSTGRARRRRSIRASSKPTARAAASTVAPWPIRCSARSSRSSCWYRNGVRPVAVVKSRVSVRSLTPASRGEIREQQPVGVPAVDEVLDAMGHVAQVAAVPQHHALLLLVAVAPRVDHHLAGDPGSRFGAVLDRDQVQSQVDPAGDSGGGDHPVVDDVQDVSDDARLRIAGGELVGQLVVGGVPPSVEQPGRTERVGAGTHAGDRATGRVVRCATPAWYEPRSACSATTWATATPVRR